ncbi:MAG: protoporphyrinogen oxidase [Deltaproteobacteria bacterium]|nr:protoporphyrinogen oxidase [Deltaproteobacteria bacterium]
MKRIAVLGGGISGLATAFRIDQGLKKAGTSYDLVILEQACRPCGKIQSEKIGDFIVESGPNGFLDNEPATDRLVKDLGIENRLIPSRPEGQKRYLLSKGKLTALPGSPLSFLLSPLLTLKGKARVVMERFISKGMGLDESVLDFVTRRLGREAAETLIDAMVSGIYAGDISRLSIKAAFPRIFELEQEYGGLFKALPKVAGERKKMGQEPGPTGQPRGRLTSFDQGMDVITKALAQVLSHKIRTSTVVSAIRRENHGYSILVHGMHKQGRARHCKAPLTKTGIIHADAVVLALPAYSASRVLAKACKQASAALANIPYAGITVIALAFDRSNVGHRLDGFGFLAPRNQGVRILGARFASSTFENRAPKESVLIEAMAGGITDPGALDLGARDLVDMALDELSEPLGIDSRPKLSAVFRHVTAIPQYNLGHIDLVSSIEEAESKTPGLWITGNALRGVAMNKCIAESERVAGALMNYLG